MNIADIIKHDLKFEALGRTFAPNTGARIKVSYEIVTPESAEIGDVSERGWENEEGKSCEPDEYDLDDGIDRVDKAVDFLHYEGAYGEVGNYDTYYGNASQNYRDGSETTNSYHLEGFEEEELKLINHLMKGGKRPEAPEVSDMVTVYDRTQEE